MEPPFETARVFANDGAQAGLLPGQTLQRLDFDLQAKQYAGIVFECRGGEAPLPANFIVEFDIRGTPGKYRLECKAVTDQGSGVWWVVRPDYRLGESWSGERFKRRHFVYAWGASADYLAALRQLEIVLTAKTAAKGYFEISNLALRELPSVSLNSTEVEITASGTGAEQLLTGRGQWVSGAEAEQEVELTFTDLVELGGLIIDWGEGYPGRFSLEGCDGSGRWIELDCAEGFRGGSSWHLLQDAEVKKLRLKLSDRRGAGHYVIRGIELRDAEFSSSINAFLSHYASRHPRGLYPRYFSKEQSYWTVISTSGGRQKALINEEGLVELGEDLPSLDAFVEFDGGLHGWSGCSRCQLFYENSLLLPQVVRAYAGLTLAITAWMDTESDQPLLYLDYELENTSRDDAEGALYVAVRPFKVNPPWQFLNTTGGHVPLTSLRFEHDSDESCRAVINDRATVASLNSCDQAFAVDFWGGEVGGVLEQGKQAALELPHAAADRRGLCSGAFVYRFALKPGEKSSRSLVCSYQPPARLPREAVPAAKSRRSCVESWQQSLAHVEFSIAAAPELGETVKSQLAYILANRDGAAIQPGTRCYRRTWIRDGAMTSSALLQHGFNREVRDFIEWYAPFVAPDGAVPAVVDKSGADTTPEHDSHGEYLFLVAEYFRYTGDAELALRLLPQLLSVARHISQLSAETDREDLPPHVRGLLPKSISHEGYSHCPAYSYWDDLWALTGLERAAEMARSLGRSAECEELETITRAMHCTLRTSIAGALEIHRIPYIPGAADLGDFDATSATLGAEPASFLLDEFPAEFLATFERYYQLFAERAPEFQLYTEGSNIQYTPYELRIVGTFVRLDQPERAHEALDFFMSHRRPRGWRHWGEVVWADPRKPAFIGDAPHGWVASDFLRAVRSMVLYERHGVQVFGAGIPIAWWREGVFVTLFTPAGPVVVRSGEAENGDVWVEIQGKPELNCELRLPSQSKIVSVTGGTPDGGRNIRFNAAVKVSFSAQ